VDLDFTGTLTDGPLTGATISRTDFLLLRNDGIGQVNVQECITQGDRVVGEAVELAAEKARLDRNRVLTGLPHPSGANAERIAFFLGRKARQALSPQVRPERLIAARTELKAKIAMLAAEHVERGQKA
jgi:hypothetical protein